VPDGFGPDDPEYLVLDLHALRARGLCLSSLDLALERLEHLTLAFTAERVALENLRQGLMPPLSRVQELLPGVDQSSDKEELWGMAFPSLPDQSVKLAIADATISHSGNGA